MRQLWCVVLAGVVLLGGPVDSAAGPMRWFAWLEELSGPGPFEGIHVPGPPVFCLVEVGTDDDVRRQWAWSFSRIDGAPRGPCVTVERDGVRSLLHVSPEATWYHSVRNVLAPPGFESADRYEVREQVLGLILYYKPWHGVDLGVGATYHRFSGDGVLGEFGFGRPALSLRARVRPLTWVPTWHGSHLAAAIGLYSGVDQMRGSFSNGDFRSPFPYSSRNDWRRMRVQLLVDGYALLR